MVIGDFGSGDLQEGAVADAVRRWAGRHPVDALVTTGDNVYESGAPAEFDAAWTQPYGWVNRLGLPVVAALGNHDVATRDGAPEVSFFHLPGTFYSRRIGPVRFVVLDANDPADPRQRSWLRRQLGTFESPWTVVVFHQPAFSCGLHRSTPGVQEAWVPLFRRFHVPLVLNGHDHDYQRFGPLGGVTYVVNGIGGQTLYPVDGCPQGTPAPVTWNDRSHGFLAIEATSTHLTVRAVADSGSLIDSFDLQKSLQSG